MLAGPDPRADDYTDDLPPSVEAFTLDPRLRASTSYIVARAATLLGMFQGADRGAWANDEGSDAWPQPQSGRRRGPTLNLPTPLPGLRAPRLEEKLLQERA